MPSIQFKGKSFVQNHHLAVPYHQLVPQPDKSLTDKVSLHDNLILQGDNLLALKALLPTYAGKVKCIYIDPPYNTGNEGWVYNDNVKSPIIKEWIGKTVGKEGEDFTRHDKWLCMMLPRLKLLRELLAEDGVIYASIDDNEQHHYRQLADEIFGENNFVCQIVWQKKYSPQNDDASISAMHEYVIGYAKDSNRWKPNLLKRDEVSLGRYKNPDDDHRGSWKPGDLSSKTKATGHSYEITSPSGNTFLPPNGRQWAPSQDTYNRWLAENRIWFGPKGDSRPSIKQFLTEVRQGAVPTTLWMREEAGDNQEAAREIAGIFGEAVFETPKPARLIKRLLQISTNADSIVLDSFAGTGTTAHATLQLNKDDEGKRKFILVEMEDYADRITAERVRKVINGIPNAKNELLKNGLGSTFSYFQLGSPIETEGLLDGTKLPSYLELARYVYYTATGEEFDESELDESRNFIGSSSNYDVYMLYKPDLEYLKQTALTLNMARKLRDHAGERRVLVFAPTKYVETGELDDLKMDFSQLPFEIYKVK